MMWFLEHIADPPAVLREARRVLGTGGAITAIEVDYSTCSAEPTSPAIEALFRAMVAGMAASGWSDAGTRLPGWLAEAGFRDVDSGERAFSWQEGDLGPQANYSRAPRRTSCKRAWPIYAACHAGTARAWAG
jgi:hypothetical protein